MRAMVFKTACAADNEHARQRFEQQNFKTACAADNLSFEFGHEM